MPRADRTEHNGERDNHHHTHTRAGTRHASRSSPLPLQASAGNRAIQHVVADHSDGGRIQRRLTPPALGRFLNRAVGALVGTNTEFTRYVLRATNPSQEGTGTFIDAKGPLTG